MRNPPRISIITPSLNQGRFIERTIKSVLEQDYPNLEYIVVDGGSTDGTRDILKTYEGRLKWISERDEGQSDAINKGIRMSSGDIIAYLNSDDVYERGALNRVADFFKNYPSKIWLSGRCRIVGENGVEVRRGITWWKNFLLDRYSYNILLVTNFISQPATFWRKEVVEEFGFLDVKEHRVMDYEYWLRIGRKYDPGVIKEYLASFRTHRGAKTRDFIESFRRELAVSKKYSGSGIINALHYLNFFGIIIAYTLLDFLERKKG
jgi:glycosyltransferase involved in cell wall biosynthesis